MRIIWRLAKHARHGIRHRSIRVPDHFTLDSYFDGSSISLPVVFRPSRS